LETDRRLVRKRVDKIKSQLDDVRQRRGRVRQNRSDRGVPTVSLVGYTNAGKSTLMNSLTKSNVLAEDKLFATLDPVTRRLRLPHGGEALLTDTVGFINKLPHSLVASFRATLEELKDASLLIHVIDLSQRNNIAQYKSVVSLLKELGLDTKPTIHVLNKIDVIENSSDSNISTKLRGVIKENYGYEDSILVSAREKHNLATLKTAIGHQLSMLTEPH
jgi:GTP-binding protein HflX